MTSPLEWLIRLDKALEARRPAVDMFTAYFNGDHPRAFTTSKWRETFGTMLDGLCDNWCELVVGASVERLGVEGFRFGAEDESADADAWEMWQANQLDHRQVLAYTEAVKCGEASVLVAPGEDGEPIITVEHPSQCIVAFRPGNLLVRAAGLKKWMDDDGYLSANVYLPEVVAFFRSKEKARLDVPSTERTEWVPRPDELGESVREHGLGAVPLVPLMNEPSMLSGGRSDIRVVIPQQDALNKLMADMVVASEYAGFRQRWATGVEIPNDPTTGKPMTEQFLSSVSRMWTVPDPDAKFGDFQATDLGNYVSAMEMVVQHIAALTRTPPHYLLGQSGAFPSGESLKSTETGLVAKVHRKQLSFGETWEEVMRLAFRVKGDTARGMARDAETLWRDPESRTTAEQTDAAIKEIACGLPKELVWRRRLGMTPQEITRAKSMAAADVFAALTATPAPQTPPGSTEPTAPAPTAP